MRVCLLVEPPYNDWNDVNARWMDGSHSAMAISKIERQMIVSKRCCCYILKNMVCVAKVSIHHIICVVDIDWQRDHVTPKIKQRMSAYVKNSGNGFRKRGNLSLSVILLCQSLINWEIPRVVFQMWQTEKPRGSFNALCVRTCSSHHHRSWGRSMIIYYRVCVCMCALFN